MEIPPPYRSFLVIGAAVCLAGLIFTAGCTVSVGDSEFTFSFGGNTHADPPTKTVRIGAFNVQVFGETKAAKPEVMEVLARIVRTYDIVAVQEIRDGSGTALPALVDAVNADGSDYVVLEGPRLGRTSSKEQYAYIYNTRTIAPSGDAFTYPEPTGSDPFHREPYIMPFRVTNGTLDAVLIVIHTDPDEATDEINALDDVVAFARTAYPAEQDFIVMGDLNADGSYFDEDGTSTLRNENYTWLIGNDLDTTTKATEYTYDRIIVTEGAVSDFTGDAGVFRFDSEYGLTENETWAVSDHYPVYAIFRTDCDSD